MRVALGERSIPTALLRPTWLQLPRSPPFHLLCRDPLKQDPRDQHRIRISLVYFQRELHAVRTLV